MLSGNFGQRKKVVCRLLLDRGLTFFAAKAATFTLRSCRYKSPVTERPLEDGRLLPRTVRSPGGPIGGRGDGAFPTDEEEEVLPWSEVGAAVRLASVSG